MKKYSKFLVLILLISCNSKNQSLDNSQSKQDSTINKSDTKFNALDTIKSRDTYSSYNNITDSIVPDIFVLKQDEFVKYQESKSFPYFTNPESNSNLFLIPYTDGSITTAILCKAFNIPDEYKNLLSSEGLDLNNKSNLPIKLERIQTLKGIDLNTSKKEFIDLFGKPNKSTIKNGMEILNWSFKMQETESKQYDSRNLQPFILNGLQFNIQLHFKQNNLITLIYSYEVP